MAQQQQQLQDHRHFRSLMFTYVLFAALGLACSFLFNSYYNSSENMLSQHLHIFSTQTQDYSLREVKTVLQGTDCQSVVGKAKLPDGLKGFMGSKLRYQFDSVVKNESAIQHCRVTKVYGLIRHGTRYPTTKHLARWKVLHQSLSEKLRPHPGGPEEWRETAEKLLEWTNPLCQDVADNKAGPTDLTEWGMKEEYCLGKRLRQRFPEISMKYSSLWYDFRSTVKTRTVKSALAYAAGLFEESNPEGVAIKTIEEKDDVFLKFDEMPCPDYDEKVTYNDTLKNWIDSFFDTPDFEKVVQKIQRYFDPALWKLGEADINIFYSLCIHETSVFGTSRWCDLFDTEDLSVLEYYNDLRAYWIKGGAYSITGKRSVHLVELILEFLLKGKQSISLSFAHAETILPLLSFLDMYPVPEDLTPTNYEELRSRAFVLSKMVPLAANLYFVLYDCSQQTPGAGQKPELYVRLLVNEKPVKIGLCSEKMSEEDGNHQWSNSLSLCKLELLGESAFNKTGGFSTLSELCKTE